MRTKAKLARMFQKEADDRMSKGLPIYGDFNPNTDQRILTQEACDEMVDCMNYMRMYSQKFPTKKKNADVIKKQVFVTWCLLQDMREDELNSSERG